MKHFQSWGVEYDGWDDPKWNKNSDDDDDDEDEMNDEMKDHTGIYGRRRLRDSDSSSDSFEKENQNKLRAKERAKQNKQGIEDTESDEGDDSDGDGDGDGDEGRQVKQKQIGWHSDKKRNVKADIEQKARDWRFEGNDRWRITYEDVKLIVECLELKFNYLLRKLDLDSNPITDRGLILIADFLGRNEGKFERLYLSRLGKIKPGSGEIEPTATDFGATMIAQSLEKNTHLKQLHMIEDDFTDKTQEAFQDVLRKNTSIECLDLSKNMKMTNAGFMGWIDALKDNRSLYILELSYMNMDKYTKTQLKYMVGLDRFDNELKKEDFLIEDSGGSPTATQNHLTWEQIQKKKHRTLVYMGIDEEEEEDAMAKPI